MLISFGDSATHTSEIKFLKQANGLDLGKLLAAYYVYYNVSRIESPVVPPLTFLTGHSRSSLRRRSVNRTRWLDDRSGAIHPLAESAYWWIRCSPHSTDRFLRISHRLSRLYTPRSASRPRSSRRFEE